MAQKQYTTYQADILSFELRDALLGALKPGRYIGFDGMSENTPPAAGDIVLDFDHTNGLSKYDQTNPTPVLEAVRGIALTTQGTVIAEDATVTQTLTFINHVSGGFHILYMNHAYLSGTQGANNATYGIKSGTGGGGLPTLDNPTRQVIIGVIKEAVNGAAFADLTYYPYHPDIGDSDLHSKLFQVSDDGDWDIGTMPVSEEGIIGNRNFANNNYLTDYTSITEALEDLDDALQTEETARIAVGNRALDDASWGALSDNTNHDAASAQHGLMPKLSGLSGDYINGSGVWIDSEVELGGDPTFAVVSGTVGNRDIRNIMGGVLKKIQFDGQVSYSNIVIPANSGIITVPVTSFSPAPDYDYYGFIWIYDTANSEFVPVRMKYTTSRVITLLEDSPIVASNVDFKVSFVI